MVGQVVGPMHQQCARLHDDMFSVEQYLRTPFQYKDQIEFTVEVGYICRIVAVVVSAFEADHIFPIMGDFRTLFQHPCIVEYTRFYHFNSDIYLQK